MKEILDILQNASPIGVIALLVVTIFYMIRNEKKMSDYNSIATNHVSGIPDMCDGLKRIEQSLIRIEQELNANATMLVKIDAKMNGKRH